MPHPSNSKPSRTDAAQVAQAVAKMMVGFREKAQDAEALASVFLEALSDLPAWACVEAAARFMRGEVQRSNSAFAPSTAELHIEASRLVEERMARERAALPAPSRDRLVPIPRRREDWMTSESWAAITVPAEEWDRIWSREAREKRAREREEQERAQSIGADTSRYEPGERSA